MLFEPFAKAQGIARVPVVRRHPVHGDVACAPIEAHGTMVVRTHFELEMPAAVRRGGTLGSREQPAADTARLVSRVHHERIESRHP